MWLRTLVLIAILAFPKMGGADPADFEVAQSFVAAQRIALYDDHVEFIGRHDGFLAPIIKTRDGGFLIVGTRSDIKPGAEYEIGKSRPVVIKLDQAGKFTWEKEYKKAGFKDYEAASAIEIDGGYLVYILSYVHPSMGSVGRFLRISSTGRIAWHAQLRGNGSTKTPFPWTVQLVQDGSLLLDGHIYLDKSEQAYKWNGKLDKNGKLVVDEIGGKIDAYGKPILGPE